MSDQWTYRKKPVYATRNLEKGTDELLNPRIDKIIETIQTAQNRLRNATAYIRASDRGDTDKALRELDWTMQELKRLQRAIKNHS